VNDTLRTILVPHDLSKHANRALQLAVSLAGPHGRLIALHVTNHYGNPAVQAQVLAAGQRALAHIVRATLGSDPVIPVEQQVASGDAYREIVKAARKADCIVMCTLGRTGLAHLLIGSVAEKVVRHAPIPVLTFRPDAVRRSSTFGRGETRGAKRQARAA
jgi:nucleotide-binding universal stress UspA family protein